MTKEEIKTLENELEDLYNLLETLEKYPKYEYIKDTIFKTSQRIGEIETLLFLQDCREGKATLIW